MGRRDHPSRGGKRRTVLQLNDTGSSYLARYGYIRNEDNNRVETNNAAGTNPLANLMGQYSSSSEEEEEEETMPASSSKAKEAPLATSSTDPRSPKPSLPSLPCLPSLPSSIPLPPQPPTPDTKSGPQAPAEGDKDIDYEVANFLAEIESLSTEVPDSASEVEAHHLAPTPPVLDREASPKPVKDEPTVNRDGRGLGYQTDPREGAEPPSRKAAASSKAYSSMFVKGEPEFTNKDVTIIKNNSKTVIKADSERDREEEDDIPDAPVSVWQQCLDENTQYYYYWNTISNQVTWEIPPEYTQYLLLYKEYEERMTRIPEERKQRKQQRDAEKAKSKSSSSKDKTGGSDTPGDDSRPGGSKEEATAGAHLPPSKVSPHGAPKGLPLGAGPQLPSAPTSSNSPKEGGSSPAQTILPPSSSEASAEASDPVQESELALLELERTFLESTKLKMKKRRQEKNKADSSSASTAATSPVQMEMSASLDTVSQSSAVEGGSSSKPGEDEEEDMEFDEEDIDRALELALERKRAELREMEEQEEKEKSDKLVVDYHHSHGSASNLSTSDSLPASTSTSLQDVSSEPAPLPSQPPVHFEYNHKRPLVEADSASRDSLDAEAPAAKLPRLSLVSYNYDEDEVSGNEGEASQPAAETETKPDVSSSTSSVGETAEKVETKTESQILVTELVDILYGKLEFLEFPKKSMSKLHRLLIELETRFTDWKGGNLDTDYFLGCLAEANGLLRQYEAGAAPDGWSCHWDRDFRRYYYTNTATGASQWDYPDEEDEPSGGAGDSVSSSTPQSKGKGPGKGRPPSPRASTSSSSQESVTESAKPGKSDSVLKETKSPSPLVSVYPGEPPPPGTVPAYAGLLPPPPPPPEPTPGEGDDYACDSNEDIDGVQMSPGLMSVDMESENEADSTQTVEPPAGSVVIAKPPQLNLPAVSSSCTAIAAVATDSASATTATTTPSLPPESNLPPESSLPPVSSLTAPDTTLPPLPESGEAGQGDAPLTLPSSSNGSVAANGSSASEGEKKEKKKKKDKITSSSLSLKKKNVSSLVQKWNQVRQEVEKEERVQENRQRDIQMKLEEWKK